VTSAGNQPIQALSGNANSTIPCGYPSVICVAACDLSYNKPWWSMWGDNVTVIAPGQNIMSSSWEGEDKYTFADGTSLAAPGVAGILAHYIGYEDIKQDVPRVIQRMQDNALTGVINGFSYPLVNTGMGNSKRAPWQPYYIQGVESQGHLFAAAGNGSGNATASNPPVVSSSGALESGPTETLSETGEWMVRRVR
jgi:subtilisin family serine protease